MQITEKDEITNWIGYYIYLRVYVCPQTYKLLQFISILQSCSDGTRLSELYSSFELFQLFWFLKVTQSV
jgi:hypothetical protein